MSATVIDLDARRVANTGPDPFVCPDCRNTGEYDDGEHFGFCTCRAGLTLYDEIVAMIEDETGQPAYLDENDGGRIA